ncbi:hypothetical protein bbp_050 [Buchnera aphidicola str. Bp (Baizongia pistaciae)]|uniref:Uncharacterized protein bbp_050 n=1 Tax=Buchnera aphidicola subsp. Baizongia pistaciae (strain Bp) TaxID=224915 RepID=Y050_BUCBP|nr:rhodanese-like domain-containing protein [Buchnera aphidicola]Q89B12.1 RecName: Full=Uncharacterized protein bbp_050 [Buchnera aphidicola str. Bp (Baizongia pistaciae)]AAO26789.1 hypothetical protein bbp_050 [Buchnera aphidicola str. Bp (Baizongia pistaciae)]
MFKIIVSFFCDHVFLSVIWLISCVLMIFFTLKDILFCTQFISIMKLIRCINYDRCLLIIDARTEKCFLKGHIINSVNIPYIDVKSVCNISVFKKYKNFSIVIVFKNDNQIDRNYVNFFKSIGCNKIYILRGGMNGWLSNNYPTVCLK